MAKLVAASELDNFTYSKLFKLIYQHSDHLAKYPALFKTCSKRLLFHVNSPSNQGAISTS